AAPQAAQPCPSALSPHWRARPRQRPPRTRVENARGRRRARASRGAAGGKASHDLRGVHARPPLTARQAAYQVVLRVFEDDAYADRAFRSAAAGLDARERALAQRLAYGT